VSHPRRPRSVLAQLIEAAKLRRGCDWPAIDAEVGITKSTRESWLNGNVKDPSLRGIMALAHALAISPCELEAAVLRQELPEWALPPAPTGAERIHEEIADVLSEKARGGSSKPGGRGRRPRSNGQPGA
jgi:hypothetical protein